MDLSEQLSRIGHKAELLVTRYATLKEANRELRSRELDLTAEIEALRTANERLRIELEYLRVSSAIAPDADSLRRAKATLAELVREIDACVADLIKDI